MMKINLNILLMVFLLPAFAEAIDAQQFIVNIPGFPYSMGRLCFVVSGIIMIFRNRSYILKHTLFLGFLITFIGLIIASFFFGDEKALTQSLGFFLLFIGSYGNVSLWNTIWFRRAISLFFIVLFLYWTIKSLGLTLAYGTESYSKLYKEGEVINHHVPGILVSVSAAFLAARFFYSENKLKLLGYIVFFLSLLTCLFVESRSNFIVSFLILIFLALRGRFTRMRKIIAIVPVLIIVIFSISKVINNNEVFVRRFTLKDMDYQQRTSSMRVSYFKAGVKEFISNPLGKGIIDTRVQYRNKSLMIHNQYLTFLVGGGGLALTGLLFIFIGAIKHFIIMSHIEEDFSDSYYRFMYALSLACATFFLTLFTIEMSGLFFFLMISFFLFVEKEAKSFYY